MAATITEQQAAERFLYNALSGFSALTAIIDDRPSFIDAGSGKCIFNGAIPNGVDKLRCVVFELVNNNEPGSQGMRYHSIFTYCVVGWVQDQNDPFDIALQIDQALGGPQGLKALVGGYPVCCTRVSTVPGLPRNIGKDQWRRAGGMYRIVVEVPR
jgi:hypothetical protein